MLVGAWIIMAWERRDMALIGTRLVQIHHHVGMPIVTKHLALRMMLSTHLSLWFQVVTIKLCMLLIMIVGERMVWHASSVWLVVYRNWSVVAGLWW